MTSVVVRRTCEALGWCGAAVVVLVTLPVVAVLVFVFRALVLAVAAALLVGGTVVFCAYAPLRQWVSAHLHGPGPTHPTG